MSILLLILAGVVIYYLYITLQDYLKNPIIIAQEPKSPKIDQAPQTPYIPQSPAHKLQKTYEGASISMLGLMLQAGIHTASTQTSSGTPESTLDSAMDSHLSKPSTSPLQAALIEDFLHTLALHNKPEYEQDLRALLTHYAPDYHAPESSANISTKTSLECSDLALLGISELAGIFLDNTYGEYKKRLQFVGFLLMLAWSDKELNHNEQDIILDIAAFLEIDNTDFNELYESFEKPESSDTATQSAKALEQALQDKLQESKLERSTNPVAQYEQVFFAHIQKLCINARKKDKPQATLLPTLWACEQAYTNTLQKLESSTAKSTPQKALKSSDSVDSSPLESKADSTPNAKSNPKNSMDSVDSTSHQATKRDSSWDNI